MAVRPRIDSWIKFADPYFDEDQNEYVWGIANPPKPISREDDQFYTLREGDRLDLIAHTTLGDVHFYWVIMHYNNIPCALDLTKFVGKDLRIPSRNTLEKVYLAEFKQKIIT